MEERIKVLISLGAATAANCIPCFEHLYYKAQGLKLDPEEIQEAVDIAAKVKSGAHVALKSSIDYIMDEEQEKTSSETCTCDCV
jgi:alkylhydroperoxidase/carboxymuconolactone decarboxylase family protein YurZ